MIEANNSEPCRHGPQSCAICYRMVNIKIRMGLSGPWDDNTISGRLLNRDAPDLIKAMEIAIKGLELSNDASATSALAQIKDVLGGEDE